MTDTSLRVLLYPLDELFFWDNQPVTNFQNREVCFVHQLIGAGRSDAQHLCHGCRVEEQRQVIITFVLRNFHLFILSMNFGRRWKGEWIPSALAGHTPYPFLPQNLTAAFSPCWYAHPALRVLAVLCPGSIIFGGGYSVVKVRDVQKIEQAIDFL